MSLAQEAFARGIVKAYRSAGIPISPAQEGMLVAAFKDAARGSKQDIKDLTGLSKVTQGAGSKTQVMAAQDALAQNQRMAQGLATAADTVGKIFVAQDQFKQSEQAKSDDAQKAAATALAEPVRPADRFIPAATPYTPDTEQMQANAEATVERLAEDEVQAMFNMEGLDLAAQMVKKRELGQQFFNEKRKIKERLESQIFGTGGGI